MLLPESTRGKISCLYSALPMPCRVQRLHLGLKMWSVIMKVQSVLLGLQGKREWRVKVVHHINSFQVLEVLECSIRKSEQPKVWCCTLLEQVNFYSYLLHRLAQIWGMHCTKDCWITSICKGRICRLLCLHKFYRWPAQVSKSRDAAENTNNLLTKQRISHYGIVPRYHLHSEQVRSVHMHDELP